MRLQSFPLKTTQDYVEPNAFGFKLDVHIVNCKSTLFNPKSKYYLGTSVFRSSSIGIDTEKGNQKVFDVGTQIMQSADISSKISYSRSEEGMIVCRGKIKLGYAVQLFELEYDSNTKRIRMKPATENYRVLKEDGEQMQYMRSIKASIHW